MQKEKSWLVMKMIEEVIKEALARKASDIHITKDLYPVLRVDGKLFSLQNLGMIDATQTESIAKKLVENWDEYKEKKYVDTSIEQEGNRFRVHVYHQQNNPAISMRLIPIEIPSFKELNLPQAVKKFSLVKSGLVLVTGTTGSGKSTTLASIIDEINNNQHKHIITVEDPIEFIYKHKKSVVNQKEVGQDVLSFADAVRAAMREDPDILLVGEMRDLETIKNTITMAETGHLVFATLHTKSVAETVNRCIDVFPADQQEQIRIQLASTIQGVVSQHLLPKQNGGRAPACEILIATDAIRSLIRENRSPNAINDQLLMNSKKTGSQTLDQSLAKLYKEQKINYETAFKYTADSENLKKMIASENP